jgi:hypothetical protein
MKANPQPILGGDTDYRLFNFAAPGFPIQHVDVGALTSTVDGPDLILHIAATGGDSENIVYMGGGVDQTFIVNGGEIVQTDYRYDLHNQVFYANVTADGQYLGNMACYTVGYYVDASGNKQTGTAGMAYATPQFEGVIATTWTGAAPPVGMALGAVTSTVLDTKDPGQAIGAKGGSTLKQLPAVTEQPITGGKTTLTLTGAAALQQMGITETALGSATMHVQAHVPVLQFDITGGTVGDDGTVILDQGSGLELSKGTGTVDFRDFLFDTANGQVDANIYANGVEVADPFGVVDMQAVFDIGPDMTLTLTAGAASLLDSTLKTQAITGGTLIGTAKTSPIELPAPIAAFLAHTTG